MARTLDLGRLPPGLPFGLGGAAAFLLLPFLLRWTGRERLVTVLSLLVAHLTILALVLADGATGAPAFFVLPALPVVSMLLAGLPGGLSSLIKVLSIVGLTTVLERHGLVAGMEGTLAHDITTRALGVGSATLVVLAIGWLYELERSHFEKRLTELNRRFELAAASAKDTLFEWDPRSNRWILSPRLGNLLGLSELEDPRTRFHPEDRDRVQAALKACIEGVVLDTECRLLDAGNRPTWFRITAVPLDYEDGRRGVCGWFRYIEYRKRIEVIKDEIIGTVSHELKTPLTSIRGGLALALKAGEGLDERTRLLLEVARRNTERLVRMVEDLLDVQRLDAGKMYYETTEVDLHTLVSEAAAGLEPLATERGVEIRIERPDAPLLVRCDADRITQVVVNLLSNALKHSPKGVAVTVRLEGEARAALLAVEDRGPGIPTSARREIFERFTQLEGRTAATRQGAGLGLHICRRIVEDHGGTIWVEDNPGGGSRFVVRLPRTPRGQLAGEAAPDEAPDPVARDAAAEQDV